MRPDRKALVDGVEVAYNLTSGCLGGCHIHRGLQALAASVLAEQQVGAGSSRLTCLNHGGQLTSVPPSVQGVIAKLLSLIETYPSIAARGDVYLAGHGSGGVIATLVALLLKVGRW